MGGESVTGVVASPPAVYLFPPPTGTDIALLIAPSDVLNTSSSGLLDKGQANDLAQPTHAVTVPFPRQAVHPFQAAISLRDVRAFIDVLRNSPEIQIRIAASDTSTSFTSFADILGHLGSVISTSEVPP